MNKIILAFLACIFLIACNKDDVEQPKIVLSQTSCQLGDDNPYVKIEIQGGEGMYKVSSADTNVVKILLPPLNRKVFYVLGKEVGKTKVSVLDENNNLAVLDINVETKVKDRVPIREKVFIKQGETKTIDFPHPNFGVIETNTNSRVASAYITGVQGDKKLNIEGFRVGEMQVLIEELVWTSFVFDVKVVDSYYMKLSTGDILAWIYNRPSYFYILSGNEDYTIESADTSVATCELQPYDGDLSNFSISNPAKVKVTPHKAGASTTITITDKDKKTKTIKFSTSFWVQ